MERLNPEKLTVEFRQGVTPEGPIDPRYYTLTHSDVTAELFLTIGRQYAFDKIGPMRDEVMAQWRCNENICELHGYVYVGGQMGRGFAKLRYNIFQKELPLALEAIRYGDNKFFETYPDLDDAPIWIYFDSEYPEYRGYRYFGQLKMYR